MPRVPGDAARHCAEIVRGARRDAWLAGLFMPEARRPAFHALHAFDVEIDRIRGLVSDPTLGEIRLQWWRDAIQAGAPTGHPVADALIAAVADRELRSATLDAYLEARVFDLYDDPMPDMATLEGHAGETASAIFQLAAIALDRRDAASAANASGHGGVALTIARVLESLPLAPQRFQTFVPVDLVAEHGASRGALALGQASPEVVATLAAFRTVARRHLDAALAAVASIAPDARAAFLPLATVGPLLDRHEAASDPLRQTPRLSPWRRQWLIWRAARRWG